MGITRRKTVKEHVCPFINLPYTANSLHNLWENCPAMLGIIMVLIATVGGAFAPPPQAEVWVLESQPRHTKVIKTSSDSSTDNYKRLPRVTVGVNIYYSSLSHCF